MDRDDVRGIMELMDTAEEFRPAIKKGIEILQSYGPEASILFNMLMDGAVDVKIRMIHRFEDAGFEREDAIKLVLGTLNDLQQGVRTAGKK